MDQDCPKCPVGLPPWLATFADLMSLLLCFFVLLLSFATMDATRFKKMAEAMQDAFGVQQKIPANEIVMGTSVIKQEFSPSMIPEPSLLDEVRQKTTDIDKSKLDIPDAVRDEQKEQEKEQEQSQKQEQIQNQEQDKEKDKEKDNEKEKDKEKDKDKDKDKDKEKDKDKDKDKEKDKDKDKDKDKSRDIGLEDIDEDLAQEVMANKIARELQQQAAQLNVLLANEIAEGTVTVETEASKIIVRIREKGSFPSGRATLNPGFFDVIDRISTALGGTPGKLVVAGHTDDVPISNYRYRSNWDLSAARAVTVVHALLQNPDISPENILVEGHADSHPLVPNDSDDNRAKNRRVELILIRGHDIESDEELKY